MAELQIEDARLEPIARKVLAGERLSFEDGVALYRSSDLLGIADRGGEPEPPDRPGNAQVGEMKYVRTACVSDSRSSWGVRRS